MRVDERRGFTAWAGRAHLPFRHCEPSVNGGEHTGTLKSFWHANGNAFTNLLMVDGGRDKSLEHDSTTAGVLGTRHGRPHRTRLPGCYHTLNAPGSGISRMRRTETYKK